MRKPSRWPSLLLRAFYVRFRQLSTLNLVAINEVENEQEIDQQLGSYHSFISLFFDGKTIRSLVRTLYNNYLFVRWNQSEKMNAAWINFRRIFLSIRLHNLPFTVRYTSIRQFYLCVSLCILWVLAHYACSSISSKLNQVLCVWYTFPILQKIGMI